MEFPHAVRELEVMVATADAAAWAPDSLRVCAALAREKPDGGHWVNEQAAARDCQESQAAWLVVVESAVAALVRWVRRVVWKQQAGPPL